MGIFNDRIPPLLKYIMKIELNKTYLKEIENFSFGDLTREELTILFRDGRTTSRFMEKLATKWFPELTNVDVKHYDHVDTEGNKFETSHLINEASGFIFSSLPVDKSSNIITSIPSSISLFLFFISVGLLSFFELNIVVIDL